MAGKVLVIAHGNLVDVPKDAQGAGGTLVFFTVASSAGKGKDATYTDCAASKWHAEMIMEHLDQYTKGRRVLVVGNQTDRVDEYNGVKRRKKTVWLTDLPQFLSYPDAEHKPADINDIPDVDGGYGGDSDDIPF